LPRPVNALTAFTRRWTVAARQDLATYSPNNDGQFRMTLIGSTAASPDDRGRFAQQIATTIPGVRDGRITMSEPVRIDGQPGYETRIDAISGKDNTPVTIVQWLRFGAQTSMRIIGSSPRDDWTKAFPRFRAVRDGIHPRG